MPWAPFAFPVGGMTERVWGFSLESSPLRTNEPQLFRDQSSFKNNLAILNEVLSYVSVWNRRLVKYGLACSVGRVRNQPKYDPNSYDILNRWGDKSETNTPKLNTNLSPSTVEPRRNSCSRKMTSDLGSGRSFEVRETLFWVVTSIGVILRHRVAAD